MSTTRCLAVAVGLISALAACNDDDAIDVSGTYTVALTNRENGCNLGNWTVGDTTSGVTVAVATNTATNTLSADVQGLAGAGLDFVSGGHVFTGEPDGANLALRIVGTRGNTMGACAYTVDTVLDGELTDNALSGDVLYQAQTNNAADCGALTGCSSRQEFAGVRPPPP